MQRTDRTDSPDPVPVPAIARVTFPTVPLLKRTAWVPSWRTDIRVTMQRARDKQAALFGDGDNYGGSA